MLNVIVWALLTGMVSGGIWVAILLRRRSTRLSEPQPDQLEEIHRRLDELHHVDQRLAEVEERQDFAERLLTRPRDAERRPPPAS